MKTLILFFSFCLISMAIFAQNQANLSLNLKQDNVYRIKSTSVTSMVQTIMDRQQNSETKTFSIISLKPTSFDGNLINAELKFDSIGFTNSMPQMDVSSAKPGQLSSTDLNATMNLILYRLTKSIIKVQLSGDGKVVAFSNLKSVSDSVLAGLDTLKGQMAGMFLNQAKNLINESTLRGNIEINTAHLPGKTVQVGEKWTSQTKISYNGIGIIITGNYKLKKITGNKAEIKADVTNEPANSDPIDMGGAQITYDARGLGEVDLIVDTTTGWVLKSSSKSHSQGNIQVKAQGQEFQMPVEIDITEERVALP